MTTDMAFEAAGKQAWIDANNLPGPVKLNRNLLDPEKSTDLDWLWIEMRSIPASETLIYRTIITNARRNLFV